MAKDLGIVVKSNRVGKVRRDMLGELAQVVEGAARGIEARAKMKAPVKTGNLRNSIGSDQESEYVWYVRVGAEYGAYVEYGTRHTAAQPFLLPALEEVRPLFFAQLKAVGGR